MEESILLLETSGEICSVALLRKGELLDEQSVNEKNSHSKLLAGMVKTILENNGLKSADLDAVAISAGPGSYTGLRIGASLAKGLCYANDLKLIAVSSLASIAYAMAEGTDTPGLYATLIDARREDAYIAVYDQAMKNILTEQFATLTPELFNDLLENQTVIFGGSAEAKTRQIVKHHNAFFMEVDVHARHLGPVALQKFRKGEFEDVPYFEPNYIKGVYVTKPKHPVKRI